jgi:hypothetical protein
MDKTSPTYSNEKMKEDDELSSSLNSNGFVSPGSICFDDVWFDANVVKSINDQVHSVRPFIESSTIDEHKNDEDHVVPRRSIFQMVIDGSKQSFRNKHRFYPVKKTIYLLNIKQNKILERRIFIKCNAME